MSQQFIHEITCPQCSHKQDTILWNSINVTVDPILEEKFFNQEINYFNCEKCKYSAFINMDLLYHNMEKSFMVQYLHDARKEYLDQFYSIQKRAEESFSSVINVPNMHKGYNRRITDDMSRFMETIRTFNEGLNDIIMHIFKDRVKSNFLDFTGTDPNLYQLYFIEKTNENIKISVSDEQSKEALYEVPISYYIAVGDAINNQFNVDLEFNHWFFVNDYNVVSFFNGL
ncbi:MAG: CpXC domain-containing protein [Leptospira sp.]|nr:CpXC domain-containing protein [Leptospira sp.]